MSDTRASEYTPHEEKMLRCFGFLRNEPDQTSSGSTNSETKTSPSSAPDMNMKMGSRKRIKLHHTESSPAIKHTRPKRMSTETNTQAFLSDLRESSEPSSSLLLDTASGPSMVDARPRAAPTPSAIHQRCPLMKQLVSLLSYPPKTPITPAPTYIPLDPLEPILSQYQRRDLLDLNQLPQKRGRPGNGIPIVISDDDDDELPELKPAEFSSAISPPTTLADTYIPLDPLESIVISDDDDDELSEVKPAEPSSAISIPTTLADTTAPALSSPRPTRYIPEPTLPKINVDRLLNECKVERKEMLRYFFELKLSRLHHYFDEIVYSDGSWGGISGGAGLYFGEDDPRNQGVHLDSAVAASSNACEYIAAMFAIELCDENVPLLICSDHPEVVGGCTKKSKYGYRTMLDEIIASRPGITAFMLVPGHSGVHGNEMADRLAYKAMISGNKRRRRQ
ncbi:hypothetical protein BCR43DRAFT_492709 [Syncephalastrum racemosum]|uniref:ribonuclease H n=1 Tax=Syncephalastrum racemosum TaxID=13706 RepID=A0A1X2H9C3_SYNRA|nr:hypothetical protein BCR43DRAFT_492709 [Syncephalastrum racemosum]